MIQNVALPAGPTPREDFLRSCKESKNVIQWRTVCGHRLGMNAGAMAAIGTRDEAFQQLCDNAFQGPPFH